MTNYINIKSLFKMKFKRDMNTYICKKKKRDGDLIYNKLALFYLF